MRLGILNWIFLSLYLGIQVAISFFVSKSIKTEDDYFVAGRSQPAWILAVSLFATWFGAETCIGASAIVYDQGLSGARAEPLGYSLCLFFSGLLLAPRIWNRKYTTLADFYADRFNHSVERVAVIILALLSLIWGAAQIRSFGHVIAATTKLNVDLAIFLSFLFVVIYTLLGGMMGDIITDVIQGGIVVLGLFLLLFIAMHDVDFFSILQSQSPERLSLLSPGESFWQRLDRWMVPICGSLVAQEIISRVLAAKSPDVAKKACYASAFIYLLVGGIPILLGLLGPSFFTVTGDSEQFLIQLAEAKLPNILFVCFSGALISALLATLDSILLGISGLISHNFLVPIFKVKAQKKKIFLARLVIVVAALLAYLLAVRANSIYELIEMSSSFGTPGVLVVTLMGLWFKSGGAKVAMATLVVGIVASPFGEYVLKLEAPFVFSLIASFLCYSFLALRLRVN